MAYGVKALRQIQVAIETVAGTELNATAVWRGTGTLKDNTVLIMPEEDVGAYVKKTRMYIPQEGGTLTLDEVPATFEHLPLLMACGIEGMTTGTVNSTGSWVYQFDVPPTGSPNTIKTLTCEMGDNQRVDLGLYGFVKSLSLSGAKGEAVMMGAEIETRAVNDTEFTASLTVPTVEEILFLKGQLWIDATTIATTTATNTWLGFSLDLPSGWNAIFTGDGSTSFSAIKYVGNKDDPITGELVLEHDATAETEITAARAGTTRLIRMLFQGAALPLAGTYTYKTVKIDAVVKYTDVPELSDEDGDDTVSLPFEVISNNTLAAQIIVVNTVNTLGV